GDIIALGSGGADQSTIGVVPHDLVLDRLLIRGDPVIGQKRGISLNSASTTITNSYIADCKAIGMDTQAIAGWNGPGPYTISNNYLEGAGENFMLGGARTMSADLSPKNVTFTRNHLAKPIAWRDPILTTPMSVRASGQTGGSLPAGTYYYFVVAARPTALDAWAWSAKSAQVSATVGAGGQVTVTWTGDSKATVYRVYRGTSSGTADRFFAATGTSFTDTGSLAPAGTDSGSWIRASRWSVKNLFELKQGVQVLVDGNLMEGNWVDSQNGFAVLFTPRSEDGMCPWAAVQDVVFSNNVVRKSASAISILGVDYSKPSQHAERIRIVNNIFERIGSADFPGAGILLQIGDGAVDVVFDHNTAAQSGNAVVAYGAPNPGFVFTNNVLRHGPYGIKGDGKAPGSDSIAAYLPGGSVTANAFGCSPNTGACTAKYYPAGNVFLTEADWQAQFVGYGAFDFRLVTGSVFAGAGTDGTALGADCAAVAAAAAATNTREAPRAPTGVVIR
ncbi:MAG TPA: hypothetical protein VK911_07210, partial [Vicinamibacterales bacterium]|nr:hypothetical protein [Vicinamibacterales bacterium]